MAQLQHPESGILVDWNSNHARLIATILITLTVYWLGGIVYNLYLHPLASFPGPFLGRATLLWRVWHTMGGRIHRSIDAQHRRHGDIVRVSPNELSFASVESWKAIYGHHPVAGTPTMPKSEFYDMYGSGFDSLCVGSERDPKIHARMRKMLSPAFSTKVLLGQEEILQNCLDGFMGKLALLGGRKEGLDMTKWFEMLAFDVLGEMAFGESFHCVENEKPHFWSNLVVEHLFYITVLDNLRRFPLVLYIGKLLLPHLTVGVRNKHSGFSREKVASRIAKEDPRKDFMANLVENVKSGEMEEEELTAHASTLVIAGGETVATFLAGATYYLLKCPDVYDQLRTAIRSRYKSLDEIDATSSQQIPYLQAYISEGLRMFPPGSQGFPRLCPGATISGEYIPAGTEVYTSAWAVTHDERYFHMPMEFMPERWLDPNSTDVKEASQPFSLGSRGCLGRNFANMEMGVILAKMHWQYDLELLDRNLDWEAKSTLHVMWRKPKLLIRFHNRLK